MTYTFRVRCARSPIGLYRFEALGRGPYGRVRVRGIALEPVNDRHWSGTTRALIRRYRFAGTPVVSK